MARAFTVVMVFGALASCAHEVAPAQPHADHSERVCANAFAPTVTTQDLTDTGGDLCAAFSTATAKLQPLQSITTEKPGIHVRLVHLT